MGGDEITIETERTRLRPYRSDDLDEHVAILSDWEVTRWLSTNIPFPYSRKDGEDFIEKEKANFIEGDILYFSVVEKKTRRHMGAIKLFSSFSDDCEVGYWLGQDFWGKGYESEICSALIEWTKKHRTIKRLVAQTAHDNVGSRKVLEKLAFEHAGSPPANFARSGNSAGCSEFYVLKLMQGLEE